MALSYQNYGDWKIVQLEDLSSATSTTAVDMQNIDGNGLNWLNIARTIVSRGVLNNGFAAIAGGLVPIIINKLTAVAAAVPVITVIVEMSLDNVTFEQVNTINLPTATVPIANNVMVANALNFFGMLFSNSHRYFRLRATAWTSGTLRNGVAFPMMFRNS